MSVTTANAVYNYPKSSCNCYKCMSNDYNWDDTGVPTNMSVRDCKIPKSFQCYDSKPFYSNIEPSHGSGYDVINSHVMDGKWAHDFQRVSCPNSVGCPKVQYASGDPRLVSVPHNGQRITLDRPPFDSSIKLTEIPHDKQLDGYGQGYKTYSDVNAGYITYYVDESIAEPFFSPNFVTPARVTATLMQDPMGAMKPYYDRQPLTCNNSLDTKKDNYRYCLSWMQDSMEHRQDLMSKQQSLYDRTKYTARWYANE